jgi:hypothetical protein
MILSDCVLQVHAALDDWAEGYHKKIEFNADMYEDVYNGHRLFLEGIREEKPLAFHRMMADLYNVVL